MRKLQHPIRSRKLEGFLEDELKRREDDAAKMKAEGRMERDSRRDPFPYSGDPEIYYRRIRPWLEGVSEQSTGGNGMMDKPLEEVLDLSGSTLNELYSIGIMTPNRLVEKIGEDSSWLRSFDETSLIEIINILKQLQLNLR